MGKVKVLHVHTRAVIGGSGTNTLLTMEGLDKSRFEAILACGPGGPLLDEARKKNLRVEVIRYLANELNIFKDTLAFFELIRLMNKERFQIVHSHNAKAGILGRIAAKCCRIPIIIHTYHSCVFLYPNLNKFQRKFYLYLEKLAASMADKIITISRPLKEDFIKARVAPPEKFIIIYSGIEIRRFRERFDVDRKRQEFGIKADELVVGTVARLAPGKGHRVFLRAAARIAKEILNVKFMIVGDGPLRQELKILSEELRIHERCIFTGLRRDIEQMTSIFDVAVLASLHEGMGRVLLEAQALAKPVVATKVGGIPDIVDEGRTGILVAPGDEEALAVAIAKLLKNETLRKQMGEAALEWVDFKFSKQRMVNKIVEVYDKCLDR